MSRAGGYWVFWEWRILAMAGFHFSNYPYDWLAIMVYGHFEHWTADQFGRRRVI
jgi:hypothetical protein